MNRLHAELKRLYLAPEARGEQPLLGSDDRVRALVLELARPADWSSLAAVWQGVQAELELPAPAIAVNGVDGYQLWFSLVRPVTAAEGQRFLQALCARYLAHIAPARIQLWPQGSGAALAHAAAVPAWLAERAHWSAFVASDLASVFADDPWLDLPPGDDAQAELLSRLACIQPEAWEAALARLGPHQPPATTAPAAPAPPPAPARPVEHSEPRAFLLQVMNDPTVDLRLRIEAAKALLG